MWRGLFAAAAVLMLAGGPRHPGGSMLEMLTNPDWFMAHALVTLGYGTPFEDQPVCGDEADLEYTYRLHSVAGTLDGADIVAEATKLALGGSTPGTLAVTGYSSAEIRWLRTETIDVDRDITVPSLNRHPAYRIDSYRVVLTK